MENQQFTTFLQQYLYLPLAVSVVSVILTAFLSYYFTFKLTQKNQNNERNSKTKDLIDRLIIEFNKIKIVLVKLRDDAEQLNYFSFKTLQIANTIGWKIKSTHDSITLLTDELRQGVLDVTDKTFYLIDEIDALEKNPVNDFTELKNKKRESSKEYRDLTVKLIDQGVHVKQIESNKYECRYIDETKSGKTTDNDDKLKALEAVRIDLLNNMHEGERTLDLTNAETAKKRTFFLIKLMDMETKVQGLVDKLQDFKTSEL